MASISSSSIRTDTSSYTNSTLTTSSAYSTQLQLQIPTNLMHDATPSLPPSVGNEEIVFVSTEEYNRMLARIENLKTAQEDNQKIIERLIRKMQELERVYFVQRRMKRADTQHANILLG
eukprot:CAMPEP_0197039726 /NCGR_PEP_ID=MMETSP1384-20130603/16512_1 /TAXON_ID=29189 /ORGANISM="Ammonia sp." /LENGTH=118 /DNA_ID=CAMNT_0042470369 /DNA_START=53 /DNA_END=409 /DNA_ORIENTATION=+